MLHFVKYMRDLINGEVSYLSEKSDCPYFAEEGHSDCLRTLRFSGIAIKKLGR